MKKYLWTGIFVLAAVWLAWRYWLRAGGEIGQAALPASLLEKTDRIGIDGPGEFRLELRKDERGAWNARSLQGEFEADASRVADFLHVMNLWEVDEIVSDSLSGSWRAQGKDSTVLVRLRSGNRTLARRECLLKNGELYVVPRGKGLWKMRSAWLASGWKDFFRPSLHSWQNRLLADWDYFEIDTVQVSFPPGEGFGERAYCLARDTAGYILSVSGWPEIPGEAAGKGFAGSALGQASGPAWRFVLPPARAEAYLSSFKQVYFDRRQPAMPAGPRIGKPLCALRVAASDGQAAEFFFYEKPDRDGGADLFKAMVVKGPAPGDTVEIPYVAYDKMVRSLDWFFR